MSNNKTEIYDSSQLLNAIALYFECMLSNEEEKELQYQLALTTLDHPAVEEAKAVMGFRTIGSKFPVKEAANVPARRKSFAKLSSIAGIAAAVALILTIAINLIPGISSGKAGSVSEESGECIAYVNGKLITNEDEVWEIAMGDAEELEIALKDCRQETSEEMEDLNTAVEHYNASYDLSDLI